MTEQSCLVDVQADQSSRMAIVDGATQVQNEMPNKTRAVCRIGKQGAVYPAWCGQQLARLNLIASVQIVIWF